MKFELDEPQVRKVKKFQREHKCPLRVEDDPWTPLTYEFSNTSGIGVIVIVRCACGAEIDVTNYSNW